MKSRYITLYISLLNIIINYNSAQCQNSSLINEKVFGGSNGEREPMIIPISDNTFFVAGRSNSNISGNKNTVLCTPDTEDVWMLKLDASLNIIWEKSIGGRFFESTVFSTLSGDSASLIIAAGSKSDSSCFKSQQGWSLFPGVYEDYWIVLVDSSGTVTTDKTLGGIDGESYPKCYQLSDGNYIVTGASISGIGGDKSISGYGDWDYWVVKFDPNGNKLWDQVYGGSGLEYSVGGNSAMIIERDSNQYLIFGTTNSGISGNITIANIGGFASDWIVWKIDNNGNVLLHNRYGGTFHDKLWDAVNTTDNGLLLIGNTLSPSGFDVSEPSIGGGDCWVVKLDSLLNIQWDRRYGGSDHDYCVCGEEAADGEYYIAGNTTSPMGFDISEAPYGNQDYWIFKIDSVGNKIWDKRFGGSDWNYLHNFVVLPDTSIILSGYSTYGSSPVKSFPGYGWDDYWLVHFKYDSTTSVNETPSSAQVDLYPNPSSGMVNIPAVMSGADLLISDISGREVASFMKLEARTLDLGYLPDGCYLFRFRSRSGFHYARWMKG